MCMRDRPFFWGMVAREHTHAHREISMLARALPFSLSRARSLPFSLSRARSRSHAHARELSLSLALSSRDADP